jgi:hypothetical protein
MSNDILARRELRLQVLQVLETLTGYTVKSPFTLPTAPKSLPFIGLRNGVERKQSIAKSGPAFTTTVTLEVAARVSASTEEDAQDMLEAVGQALEAAVLAAPDFVRMLQQIASVTTQTEISGEGSTFLGELLMQVDCECYEEYDPTVIDPGSYPGLQNMQINVDTIRPFDAQGTYVPRFGDGYPIAAAPRLAGPDGRNEATLSFDMTQGTPMPIQRLRCVGQQIIGPDGNPVRLRGINWGRWGTAIQQDAWDAKAQGATCVRIPLRWWGLYASQDVDSRDDAELDTYAINPDNLAILDDMIRWATEAGLWIILFVDSDCGQNGLQDGTDSNWFPGGTPAYCDPDGLYPNGHNFWTDLEARAKFLRVLQFVARRYANCPRLGLIEPLPEPNPSGYQPKDINAFYQEAVPAVRLVLPDVPIIVGGRAYSANNINPSYMPGFDNIVYTADMFLHTGGVDMNANLAEFAGRVSAVQSFQVAHNVPILIQQTGVNSGDDDDQHTALTSTLDQLNAAGFHWAYWEERDSANPDGYGIRYRDGNGGWIIKVAVQAIVAAHYVQ